MISDGSVDHRSNPALLRTLSSRGGGSANLILNTFRGDWEADRFSFDDMVSRREARVVSKHQQHSTLYGMKTMKTMKTLKNAKITKNNEK